MRLGAANEKWREEEVRRRLEPMMNLSLEYESPSASDSLIFLSTKQDKKQ